MKITIPKVLAEDIYHTVKEDILNAVLAPEAVLDEVQLMQRFRVSRTPVREAIRRLVADGLVCMEPHRSAYVKPLSMSDIADFFEAYALLQRTVFILSAHRITEIQLEKARKIQDGLEQVLKSVSVKGVRDSNMQFHAALAAGCGNRYLQDSYAKLLDDSARLSSLLLTFSAGHDWRGHVSKVAHDHRLLLADFMKRDLEAVAEHSDEHVAFFKDRVIRVFDRETPAAALPTSRIVSERGETRIAVKARSGSSTRS